MPQLLRFDWFVVLRFSVATTTPAYWSDPVWWSTA